MNTCAMFGYWGLFTGIPGYLALSEKDGGRGLGIIGSLTWVLFMAPGKRLGYVLFGFAVIASELFPTEIRASAMGLTYNIGPGFSAIAPFVVGAIAKQYSFLAAFLLLAAAFLAAALLALALPETRGQTLD